MYYGVGFGRIYKKENIEEKHPNKGALAGGHPTSTPKNVKKTLDGRKY